MLAEIAPHEVTVCTVVRGGDPVERLLAALDEQSLPAARFDVVVVDATPSGDWTGRELSYRYRAQVVRVDPESTPGAALNAALRIARGEAVAFLGADVVPSVLWLADFGRAVRRGRRLVSGRWLPTDSSMALAGPLSYRLWAVERETHLVTTDQLGCRRADLERSCGFDESIADPRECDLDLALRLVDAGVEPYFDNRLVCSYDVTEASLAQMVAARRDGAASVEALAGRPQARARLLAGGLIRPGAQPQALLALAGLLLMARDRRAALLVVPWWHHRTCVAPHAGGKRRRRFVLPGVLGFDLYDAVAGLVARVRSGARQ
ncbi:MAG TPA: glycosyltransferase [Mycobacteriales bacterium]|jgi:hypothetical protein|nr:glycosyltransferase [Mycobacteriales bacterium]